MFDVDENHNWRQWHTQFEYYHCLHYFPCYDYSPNCTYQIPLRPGKGTDFCKSWPNLIIFNKYRNKAKGKNSEQSSLCWQNVHSFKVKSTALISWNKCTVCRPILYHTPFLPYKHQVLFAVVWLAANLTSWVLFCKPYHVPVINLQQRYSVPCFCYHKMRVYIVNIVIVYDSKHSIPLRD